MSIEKNTIAILEEWVQENKFHSAEIVIGNGQKVSCWSVRLFGKGSHSVTADEVGYIEHDPRSAPENYIVAAKNSTDWPGLEATILAAVTHARALGI